MLQYVKAKQFTPPHSLHLTTVLQSYFDAILAKPPSQSTCIIGIAGSVVTKLRRHVGHVGQVSCHVVMHTRQKTCRHGLSTGVSSTLLQMQHTRSGSGAGSNRSMSYRDIFSRSNTATRKEICKIQCNTIEKCIRCKNRHGSPARWIGEGFLVFQANKIPPHISLMNFQNSRTIRGLNCRLGQSLMLLQSTVVAANIVKLRKLVCIVM